MAGSSFASDIDAFRVSAFSTCSCGTWWGQLGAERLGWNRSRPDWPRATESAPSSAPSHGRRSARELGSTRSRDTGDQL